ncbi:hypothetical protein BV25DRAFT_1819292 [Artomyces pyxidatus]|uniref:Uncharacterized protein n=1 Tax=Artomyces pyxidatus TaxID=48021 RepID=A0ACB8THF4_9AGAM|nr:hypothetical protein BV25DRAFT_1819292 [Artomyces pyxidatus]
MAPELCPGTHGRPLSGEMEIPLFRTPGKGMAQLQSKALEESSLTRAFEGRGDSSLLDMILKAIRLILKTPRGTDAALSPPSRRSSYARLPYSMPAMSGRD